MASTFINRVSELSTLRQTLWGPEDRNRITIILGDTGIGKSALSQKIIDEHRGTPGVKVRVLAGEQKDGYYIHEIAKAIDVASGDLHLPSLQYFLRHLKSEDLRKHYVQAFARALGEADPYKLAKAADLVLGWVMGTGAFSAERLFRSGSSEVTLALFEYVRHVLGTRRLILNVENIQSIDRASLNLLLDLLRMHKQHSILLEFTTDKPGTWSIGDLREILEGTDNPVKLFRLKMLPFSDVAKLVPSDRAESFMEQAYYRAGGNLKDFADLQVVLLREPSQGDVSSENGAAGGTALRISLLQNKSAVFTLCCIAAHHREVSLDLLHTLAGSSHPFFQNAFIDITGALEDLRSENLVSLGADRARVEHDWVADVVLSAPEYEKYRAIAFQLWAHQYDSLFRSGDYRIVSQNEVLYNLFWFYLNTSPERLYGVVGSIKAYALGSLYPRHSLSLLEKLRTTLAGKQAGQPHSLERVNVAILDIYYQLGLFNAAFQALEALEAESPLLDVYRAALLDRLDRQEEAIVFIRARLSRPRSPRLEYTFYLKLILMTSYRSTNRDKECERLYQQLIRESRYKPLPAYPYLLRNAQIVLDGPQAMQSVRSSIAAFAERGDPVGEGHARITLAMYLAMGGEISLAEEQLLAAERLLDKRSMERHVGLNDRAALHLLRAQTSPHEALALLNSALTTATAAFERAAIYNNMLISYTLQGNFGTAEEVEHQLLIMMRDQPDQVLQRSTYFNLAYAAETRGDHFSAERFSVRAKEIGSRGDEYWQARLGEPRKKTSHREFMLSFPYTTVFVTNWHLCIEDFTTD